MRGVWSWCFSLAVFVGVCFLVARPVIAVVGGAPAAAPEPDAAVVFTQLHGRSARIEGIKDNRLGYYSFYGIRYAEPPVGPRRFQRPVRRDLVGELNATSACQKCPQPDPNAPQRMIGHEDCLCLNLFSPKMPGEERGSPVIFFIHGGNYRTGSASPYGGKHLTQEDTILVVAQYRLGSLGFISNGQKEASGNAALFDIYVALNWVKDYIQFFGGDPTRITVMGQGSGGSAASLMALSSEGRSSDGVVALSGTALSPGAVRTDPAKHAQELAKRTGCPETPVERLVLCLKKLPPEQIIKADNEINSDMVDTDRFLNEISGRQGAGARVEGADDHRGLPTLVMEPPAVTLKKKRQTSPLLTGVTSAETERAVFGKYSKSLTSQLQKIKDFIKKDIIGGLKNVVSAVEGLKTIEGELKKLPIIGDFEEYYNRLAQNGGDIVEGLAAIAEVTGDALFNFPAFKSVKDWSQAAPAYLYSFEFNGNLTKGSHFLPGVALAEESSEMAVSKAKRHGPAHGDDLAYIFDPLDDNGNSVEGTVSQMDSHVRKNFLGVISQFAHNLKSENKNTNQSKPLFPFLRSKDTLIKITDNLKSENLDQSFRFCQMGIWGNMADRLLGSVCQNEIKKLLELVPIPTELNPVPILSPILTNLSPNPNSIPNQKPNNVLPNVFNWG
ncbi:unnamed protein product [Chilo suppressalis]|uniref:Carboxylesterase type B domain-containing protein n=2 Tax=Chilo suppressalis TaxID=168631 RepID=A0ABN8AT81_CHISP|nr:hypothetical protein evm_005168 [Chilo suppressalis]CAH0399091.1 unnamed protein product [Chilo suppressalis]